MHDLIVLRDLLILVGVAIPIVALAQQVRVPSVIGFVLAGVVIGPNGLALISGSEEIDALAEIGVVLLLFTIGLELSFSQLARMGRTVVLGGALQVGLTMGAVALAGGVLGLPTYRAVFYGALVALSSTAVVLKLLTDRGELDTSYGRVAVAILLFQDLAVVALMLLVPVLAHGQTATWPEVLSALGESLAVIGVLVLAGKFLVPAVLDRIVLLRNRELFVLSIGFFGLVAAYWTAAVGLSLALGSFLAGLVISESRYSLQALSDAIPFRDAFTGIFFMSVGMLLSLPYVWQNLGLVAIATVSVVGLKAVVATLVILAMGRGLRIGVLGGLTVAQVGEFSFVLAAVALPLGLFAPGDYQLFLSASVLTILMTPALRAVAPAVADVLTRLRPAAGPIDEAATERLQALSDHAILIGYGLTGRHVARVLHAASVPYVVLEQNGELVNRGREDGMNIVFGDGTRVEILKRLGVERARVVVFAIASPADEKRGLAAVRELNPSARTVVRTKYVAAMEELVRLGASEIVVEEFEATLEVFARVLELYEIPTNTIHRELEAVRGEHYSLLRDDEMALDMKLDKLRHLGIHSALELVEVEEGSSALGESPTSLDLRKRTGAIVIAVIREGRAIYRRDPNFSFRAGDTAVLVGEADALSQADAVFRTERGES